MKLKKTAGPNCIRIFKFKTTKKKITETSD